MVRLESPVSTRNCGPGSPSNDDRQLGRPTASPLLLLLSTCPANPSRFLRDLADGRCPAIWLSSMEFHMDFHKIWQEQSAAARTVRERFGVENALDYLVGEKLLNFAKAAEQDLEFAAELPRFQTAVWEIFNPYELRGYVASVKPSARRKRLQKLLYVSP